MNTFIELSDGRELDSSKVLSCKYTSTVNAETDIKLGSACSDSIEVSIWDADIKISAGELLVYYKVDVDGTKHKVGHFVAQRPTSVSDHVYKVTAYDYMASKLEVPCEKWLAHTMFASGDEVYSLDEFAKAVCCACGVVYAGSGALLNSSYTVNAFSLENGTFRQLVRWIAEVGGCYAHMDADGRLCFCWYRAIENSASPTEGCVPYVTADNKPYMTALSEPYYVRSREATLNIYSQSREDYNVAPIDAVRAYTGKDTISAGSGTNIYDITDNPIIEYGSAVETEAALECILERLSALCYSPATIEIQDNCLVHTGDIIEVFTRKGIKYQTVAMSICTTSGGRMEIVSSGNVSRESAEAVSASYQKTYAQGQMQRDTSRMIKEALVRAETEIRGQNGGVRVDHVDENGHVYETLYLDTMSEETAQNVMRLNSAGIGFSTTGVNGEFTMALTVGGGLANQWVRTWNLVADVIKTGTLEGVKIIATQGSVGGLSIFDKTLGFDFRIDYPTFTEADLQRLTEGVTNNNLTQTEIEKYDVNLNGRVDSGDAVIIRRMIDGLLPTYSKGRFYIDSSSYREPVVIEITEGFRAGEKVSFGAGVVRSSSVSADTYIVDGKSGITRDVAVGGVTLHFCNGILVGVTDQTD